MKIENVISLEVFNNMPKEEQTIFINKNGLVYAPFETVIKTIKIDGLPASYFVIIKK